MDSLINYLPEASASELWQVVKFQWGGTILRLILVIILAKAALSIGCVETWEQPDSRQES